MVTCEFSLIIHSRGWKVIEACRHWGIRYDVFRRSCRNEDLYFRVRLADQCRGLENKC